MRSHALPAPATGLILILSAWNLTSADESFSIPCADLPAYQDRGEGDFSGVSAEAIGSVNPAGEECDPEEGTLFPPLAASDDARAERDDEGTEGEGEGGSAARRGTGHTVFTLSRTPSAGLRRIVRHRATHRAWSHAVELRGDSLVRRRLVWHPSRADGPAWRVAVGDMTDTALRLWPRGLPRRALPVGWAPAHGPPEAPQPWAATVPQGFGAGVFQDGWSAYALRIWNPVTTKGDRPWDPVGTLRHEVAGASLPLGSGDGDGSGSGAGGRPWRLFLHASATRITRAAPPRAPAPPPSGDTLSPPVATGTGMHPLSERMLATELLSPARGLALTAAVSENDRAPPGPAGRGVMLGAAFRTRLSGRTSRRGAARRAGALTLDATVRQRSADWTSAWDPALTVALLEQREESWGEERREQGDGTASPETPEADARLAHPAAWGAGEVRIGGRWTAARALRSSQAPPADREGLFASSVPRPSGLALELWRTWNPPAGTARQGVRGTADWRLDETRLTVTATQRRSRAASGARSLYRFAQADARLTRFPRARATAWRAWNAAGPLRTGLFLGAEPAWRLSRVAVTATPGLKLEVKTASTPEAWSARATAGIRMRAGAWTLEADADAPVRAVRARDGQRDIRARLAFSLLR